MAIKPFTCGNTSGHATYAEAYWCMPEVTFRIERQPRRYGEVDTDVRHWVKLYSSFLSLTRLSTTFAEVQDLLKLPSMISDKLFPLIEGSAAD